MKELGFLKGSMLYFLFFSIFASAKFRHFYRILWCGSQKALENYSASLPSCSLNSPVCAVIQSPDATEEDFTSHIESEEMHDAPKKTSQLTDHSREAHGWGWVNLEAMETPSSTGASPTWTAITGTSASTTSISAPTSVRSMNAGRSQ